WREGILGELGPETLIGGEVKSNKECGRDEGSEADGSTCQTESDGINTT
ncbi:unnamed protein product, partial [Brassica rapa]